MSESISIREFARREHVSDTLVHFALSEGRLTRLPSGKMDASLVGTAWRARRESAKSPAKPAAKSPAKSGAKSPKSSAKSGAKPGEPGLQFAGGEAGNTKGPPYGEALRLKEVWNAMLRRLEYEHKAGSLVELSIAQDVLFEAFRLQRDSWLNWPSRIAPQIAAELGLDDIERLTGVLSAHVHAQIDALGEPSGNGLARQP